MGNLFIVATPIGNLQDITIRALNILRDVDFIACEDTRKTSILIKNYFKDDSNLLIQKLYSYYEEVEEKKIPQIINILLNGKDVALVSDAGTPAISDPGFKLIRACKSNGINVISVPGPSAVVSALVASGLPTDKFTFMGFLPKKQGHKINLLKKLSDSQAIISSTVIIYESPYKLVSTLQDLKNVFGNIEVVIVREQTKVYEEIIKENIDSLIGKFSKTAKGEFVLLFNTKKD